MATIRDVMPAFELFQPTSVEAALALLDEHGADAWVLAGGLDSFDWLKDRIKRPRVVVDLSGVAELKGIRERGDGLEIGAMTTLTEVVRHPLVGQKFAILLQAAEAAASPQIRNQGTIGGNVSQDTRCWYYRAGWPCYRAGGNICYADTPQALNREHAIFDADRCVAVNPSDTAPALIALGAQMVIRGPRGERVVEAEDYFVGPGTDITRMHALATGELLTAIRIPGTFAGARFYFEKVADRNVWDFPLVNVAAAMRLNGGTVQADPHRRQRRGGPAPAAAHRRAGGAGPRARRGHAGGGRRRRHRGRAAAAAQRLQGAAAPQPGAARHPRVRGFLAWTS